LNAPIPQANRVVLVTGFEANDPPHRNASAMLVEALTQDLTGLQHAAGGAEVRTSLMPGDTAGLAVSLEAALSEQPRPTHLLLLGQAPGRSRITLERFATNLCDFGSPDRYGNLPRNVPVVQGGPPAFCSTWPEQMSLVAALNAASIPAAMSNDAGNHLCNQLLYLALHAAVKGGHPCAITFVHIPMLPQQVIAEEPMTVRHPNCPYLPLPILIDAIGHLLRAAFLPRMISGEISRGQVSEPDSAG